MEPFLYKVADHIYKKFGQNLNNVCLVFPNRRSGMFFIEYLKNINNKTIWIPQILTISEFVSSFTDIKKADNITLLADLYSIYKKISKLNEQFDEFYIWGELMLNDFDDVDKYMANPDSLFTNVRELKNIDNKTDYLTQEQIEVLKLFFANFDPEKKSKLKDNFLEIWQLLLPIYKQFTQTCIDKKQGYEGLIYRQAVNEIKNNNLPNYNYQHTAFIGFNAINQCEWQLFDYFKQTFNALFYWDYDPYYINTPDHEAAFFISKFVKHFAVPNDFVVDKNMPHNILNLELFQSTTDNGQITIAQNIINNINTTNYANTALILANESLLQPVLQHVPAKVPQINVTMGYQIKDTIAAPFIDLLAQLQTTCRVNKTNNVLFYHKVALPLLQHPYISAITGSIITLQVAQMATQNIFYIDKNNLPKHQIIDYLFTYSPGYEQFADYIEKNLSYIISNLANTLQNSDRFAIDIEFLHQIYQKNNLLIKQIKQHELSITLQTYIKLLKKITATLSIPFTGEPIKGLQVMGFLESRNLDFENIIILSFNEGQLPASQNSSSFIPYSLRQAFGLPTRQMHDSMYAYYFYRLLQRSKNVSLIYCSSSNGLSTGEPSRYAYQLKYNNNFKLKATCIEHNINIITDNNITIKKEGLVKKALLQYINNNNKRILSPSAITTYLTCQLKFYFSTIMRLRQTDSTDEQVDARQFGNIFHNAAEELYKKYAEKNIEVTNNELTMLNKNNLFFDNIINQAFAKTFWGNSTNAVFSIEGKNRLVADAIKNYLLLMIKTDQNYAPFYITGLEKHVDTLLNINVNNTEIQLCIGGTIDRMFSTNNALHIVDYKTGSDNIIFETLPTLFNPETIKKHKAIIQTFIYSLVCHKNQNTQMAIIPMVYQVKHFNNNNNFVIKSKSQPNFDDSNFVLIAAEFENLLKQLLLQIFNYNIPFTQTTQQANCINCDFKTICGR